MADDVPPPGSMYLYDHAQPPLRPGAYRFEASTSIEKSSTPTESLSHERYFNVEGPRFVLNPGDIAGVVPPRNSQGPFSSVLPQMVLRRRTLPWERVVAETLPAPSAASALPNQNPAYPTPWLALLLLAEGENWELKPNLPLESVLPGSVFNAIGKPANVLVEALDIQRDLLEAILPAREELQLLSHVRRVNAEDRELSIEGSDGWFSVIVCNRLPTPGKKCSVVLVSLEGRTDLLAANPPPFVSSKGGGLPSIVLPFDATAGNLRAAEQPFVERFLDSPPSFKPAVPFERVHQREEAGVLAAITLAGLARTKLVALHAWNFTCEGEGDFMMLMQRLDVGLIGKVRDNKPQLTDTGHLRVELGTRAGTKESALYRGPLVPMPLQRDPAGPYHSADQARRIAPELGMQDISYACAFEVGRLLAAADARLAQELMRWRRNGFRAAARLDVYADLEKRLNFVIAETIPNKLQRYVLPMVAAELIDRIALAGPAVGDPFGIKLIAKVAGLQPERFADAFSLDGGIAAARNVLLGLDYPLGIDIPAVADAVLVGSSLEQVLADGKALAGLGNIRQQVIANVRTRIGAIGQMGGATGVPAGPAGKAPSRGGRVRNSAIESSTPPKTPKRGGKR